MGVETAMLSNSTFVRNSELINGGRAIGDDAQALLRLSSRSIWRPVGTVVLPKPVDPAFQEYVADNGREPEVVVPEGINPRAISLMDGIEDEAFQRAIGQGRTVESYVVDMGLGKLVNKLGGSYFVDQPVEAASMANDKARYASIVEDIVDVPEGVAVTGIQAVVEAAMVRLTDQKQKKVFIRHTVSGGGIGNRAFNADSLESLDPEYIRKLIEGDYPQLWANNAALVEEQLDLIWSPAVSFNQGRFTADNLQITRGGYVGSLSPVPEDVIQPERLEDTGNKTAQSLLRLTGYNGPGNNDLGITRLGRLCGFEINARSTALTHALEVGKLFFGEPWSAWRRSNHVIKTLDYFELKAPIGFRALRDQLATAGFLATRDNPYGVVITIPPNGSIAGIQIQGRGYKQVEELYQKVDTLIGAPQGNRHDNPYIPR